jgi:hypothetical protein
VTITTITRLKHRGQTLFTRLWERFLAQRGVALEQTEDEP